MQFNALIVTATGEELVLTFEAKAGEDLLDLCRKHSPTESKLIQVCLAPTCPACQCGDASQLKHMQRGGCLSESQPKRGKRAAAQV